MNSNQQLSDYIFYYPEAMSPSLCDKVIKHFETQADWKQSTFSTSYNNTGTSKVSMEEYWIGKPVSHYQDIKNTFEYCLKDYTHFHNKIKSVEFTDFRINRYTAGGFMKEHIDNIHHSHGQKQGYPHLTSLIFLNDDYEGGDFVLCGDKYIEKVQGSAIVFPSNFMFPHEVKEVKKGKRYSIMTWIL